MIEQWGNDTAALRVKAALKREIAPGVPFSGVIARSTQGEFTWAPVDSMHPEEFRAMLRYDMENCGADMRAITQKQRWGRLKWPHLVDEWEEFSPTWYQRYLDMADDEGDA